MDMSPSSYEHRILAAALRLEAAQSAGDYDEMRAALNEVLVAARGMRLRRKEEVADIVRDHVERVREARVEYDIGELARRDTEPPDDEGPKS